MKINSFKLERARIRFEKIRNAQEEFVHSLPTLIKLTKKKYVSINLKQKEVLCEMAFVVLLTAWEQFMESTFESLVVDAPASSFRKRHKVIVVDVDTVHDLIRGDRLYFEWSDYDKVRNRAKVFFKAGEPFESVLQSIADDWKNMKIIRNRCVHFSQHSIEQYKKMLRRVMGSGIYISPGKILLEAPPKGLSKVQGALSYGSVFKLYSEILATASNQILSKKS